MSSPNSRFDVTRANQGAGNVSGKYAIAAPRGLALGAHASDAESFSLAQHNNFLGFLTRDVVVGGLTLTDRVFGRTSADPVGPEGPFTAGEEVSLEKAYEIEAEGAEYLVLSGTGEITSGTTVPQSCSFVDGKLRITQSGEVVNATLTAVGLTSTDGTTLRCRFEVKN